MEASWANIPLHLSPCNAVLHLCSPSVLPSIPLLENLSAPRPYTGNLREETLAYIRCSRFLYVDEWRKAPEGMGSRLQRPQLLGLESCLFWITNSLSSFPVLKAIFPTRRCPQQECCRGSREFSAMWTILVFRVPPRGNLLELCQTITTPCKCWDSHQKGKEVVHPFILVIPQNAHVHTHSVCNAEWMFLWLAEPLNPHRSRACFLCRAFYWLSGMLRRKLQTNITWHDFLVLIFSSCDLKSDGRTLLRYVHCLQVVHQLEWSHWKRKTQLTFCCLTWLHPGQS